jgi:flagellar protein FliO/FliZ
LRCPRAAIAMPWRRCTHTHTPAAAKASAVRTTRTLGPEELGAGVWVWVQRRQGIAIAARGQRKLQIEETRPLGGRQYLVVANYDGKKYLLGITPGRINLLTPLESSPEAPPSPAPEVKS